MILRAAAGDVVIGMCVIFVALVALAARVGD
jgi:hypothetical protein